eukprot:4869513-Prymnesium_polylepis.1
MGFVGWKPLAPRFRSRRPPLPTLDVLVHPLPHLSLQRPELRLAVLLHQVRMDGLVQDVALLVDEGVQHVDAGRAVVLGESE